MTRPHLPTLALLAALLAGCGDAATTAHRGDALATLKGQMSAAPGVQLGEDPVRLALAWYPDLSGAVGRPAAIVAEDVDFEGTFPLDYTFRVFAPPPAAALSPLEAPFSGRGAFGVLLAYTDGNGNGRLDPIRASTPLAERDHLVAASWQTSVRREGFVVGYVDAVQAAETGLAPGLNLARISESGALRVVPLSTHIPLALEDRPLLDLQICEDAWSGTADPTRPCGLELDEPVDRLFLEGSVQLVGARLQVDLALTRVGDDAVEPAARVELNGETIPYDALLQRYALARDGWASADGRVQLRVSLDGGGVRSLLGTLPAAPVVLTPAAGASVPSTQPLEVSWQPLAGADSAQVRFDQLTPAPQLRELMTFFEAPLPTRWSSDSAPGLTGPARVSLTARSDLEGDLNHAALTLDRVTQVDFTLAP